VANNEAGGENLNLLDSCLHQKDKTCSPLQERRRVRYSTFCPCNKQDYGGCWWGHQQRLRRVELLLGSDKANTPIPLITIIPGYDPLHCATELQSPDDFLVFYS